MLSSLTQSNGASFFRKPIVTNTVPKSPSGLLLQSKFDYLCTCLPLQLFSSSQTISLIFSLPYISSCILNTPEHSPFLPLTTSVDCMCDLLVFQVHFISGSHLLHSQSEEMKCGCDDAVGAVIRVLDVV